jgi:hypothetical protein
MAKKNENVAALLSMYWDSVARNPLGPGPDLTKNVHLFCTFQRDSCYPYLRILYEPKIKPIVSPTPPPINAPILGRE